ncbi:PAS domain S-box protein [Myxococcota bacterium]|nr:PAS domain S-box protein [Myxococcota bacterium]
MTNDARGSANGSGRSRRSPRAERDDFGILEVDVEGRVLDVNARLGEILGYAPEELVGMTIDALTAPEDRERSHALNARVGAGALDVFEYEKRYLRKDGTKIWAHVTVSAQRDSTGAFQRAIGAVQPLSARSPGVARGAPDAKFRALFEHAAIGMGIVRFEDARWMDVNATFCRMLGRSRQEMLRTPWPEITHPEDVELDLVPFRRMAKGELDSYRVEKRFVHREGHLVWARLTLSLVRDEHGRPDYEIAIVEDIGDRKAAEEALRRAEAQREAERAKLQVILETLPVGFFVLDADGVMVLANDLMKETLGDTVTVGSAVDPARARGHRPDTGEPIMAPDWPCARALRGERVDGEMIDLEAPDGTRRTIITSSAPILDASGRVVGAVAANQDISELRAMQARLQEADQRKSEFLAVLSHELRNPLTPIRNSIHILERAAPGGAQAKRALEVIDRQVMQMTHLVEDLLDVTRISRGKIRLQRQHVDLREPLRCTADDARASFRRSGIDFELSLPDEPVPANVDRTRVAQIVGNLLHNAMKFTPPGGHVLLALERDGARARVRVKDTGVGIEPHLRAKLFEPFVQADNTLDRTKGGLGLGLALVRGLVELHGGTVEATSEGPGRGAELIFDLPLEPEAAQPEAAPREPRGPARPLRVLVIEDNADAAESLRQVLELDGHDVDTAATGLEGLERATHAPPDVVLCDLGLPGIDGFEVARRLRRDPNLTETHLVALSGYAAPEDQEKSREAGFEKHLAKPPDLEALEATLRSYAKSRTQPTA